MPDNVNQVPGEPASGVSSETPATGGVANATPANPPVDADALRKQIESELRSKYESDISKLKSSLQSREGELTKTLKDKERELKETLHKTRLASMDEEQRKTYEQEILREQLAELQEERDRATRERDEQFEYNKALSFFLEKKVPVSVLVKDQGYQGLLASGWEYITNRLEELEKGGPPKSQVQDVLIGKEKTDEKVAPPVDTKVGSPPAGGPKWEDMVGPGKRFESREDLYAAFEAGRLPPDAVPQ